MTAMLDIYPEVHAALDAGRPVVALESTVIAHGLPWPDNLETARILESAVRAEGAVPATIGIVAGRIRIGLDATAIERFARGQDIAKVSRADLASVVARGGDGATTVAATMSCAAMAGIRVFATGGIGGVHRGSAETMDISADLTELARTDVAVVCSGAKSILDLPKTLEVLETLGVPVVGYGTDRFPAFYVRDSGLALGDCVDTPEDAARLLAVRRALGLGGGSLIANPIPAADAVDPTALDGWTAATLAEAHSAGLRGKAVTPFLLRRIAELSAGKTRTANVALLRNNAAVAARITVALSRLET